MAGMRKWWGNGGKKDLIIALFTAVITVSIAYGDYKRRFLTLENKVDTQEDCFQTLDKRLSIMEGDIRVIKTYVTGKME